MSANRRSRPHPTRTAPPASISAIVAVAPTMTPSSGASTPAGRSLGSESSRTKPREPKTRELARTKQTRFESSAARAPGSTRPRRTRRCRRLSTRRASRCRWRWHPASAGLHAPVALQAVVAGLGQAAVVEPGALEPNERAQLAVTADVVVDDVAGRALQRDRRPHTADEAITEDAVPVPPSVDEQAGCRGVHDQVGEKGVVARADAVIAPLDLDSRLSAGDHVPGDHGVVGRMLEVDARARRPDPVADDRRPRRRADRLDPVPARAEDGVPDDRRLDAAGPDAALVSPAARCIPRVVDALVAIGIPDVADDVVQCDAVERGRPLPELLLPEQDPVGAEAPDAGADHARVAGAVGAEREHAGPGAAVSLDDRVLNRNVLVRAPDADAVSPDVSDAQALEPDVTRAVEDGDGDPAVADRGPAAAVDREVGDPDPGAPRDDERPVLRFGGGD